MSDELRATLARSIIGKRKRERQLLGPGGRGRNVTRRYRRAVGLCMNLVIIYAKRDLQFGVSCLPRSDEKSRLGFGIQPPCLASPAI